MEQLMNTAAIFLMIFGAVAAIDGLYLHLWKYKLYARPESLYEHKMHTAQAFLFIPVVFLLFYKNVGGWLLWVAVAFVLIEFVVEMMDVLEENQSRASLGGLTSTEYAIHVVAITVRTVAIALVFAAKPLSAWSLSSPSILAEQFQMANNTGLKMMIGNVIVGALHIWLMQKKYQTNTNITNTPVEVNKLTAKACC